MTTSRIEVTPEIRAEAVRIGSLAGATLPDVYAALAGWALGTLGTKQAAAIVAGAVAARQAGEQEAASEPDK